MILLSLVFIMVSCVVFAIPFLAILLFVFMVIGAAFEEISKK